MLLQHFMVVGYVTTILFELVESWLKGVSRKKPEKKLPLTPEELVKEFALYNAIYSTLGEYRKKNSHGCFTTDSISMAIEIWSLASDWESLITHEVKGKQAAL